MIGWLESGRESPRIVDSLSSFDRTFNTDIPMRRGAYGTVKRTAPLDGSGRRRISWSEPAAMALS